MYQCFGKILPAGVLKSPGVFQELLDLIFKSLLWSYRQNLGSPS